MGLKILLVDDEPAIRNLLRATLGRLPAYEFLEAEDGYQALELAEREHPDLVLLDIIMPRMDGFEVCRRLRALPAMKETPILMLAAQAQESDRESGIRSGADDFFTKPFSPTGLTRKIEALLERPRRHSGQANNQSSGR